MRKFSELIIGIVKKKNYGYKFHRFHSNYPNCCYFEKSLGISKDDVKTAKTILKIINVRNQEDLFLALTCMSVLSSYEKRQKLIAKNNGERYIPDEEIGNLYKYKALVNRRIIDAIKSNVDFNFCVKQDSKGKDVTYVEVGGVQFSFHNTVSKEDGHDVNELSRYYNSRQHKTDLEWDRSIAFQNGAKEVFLFALHLKNLTKLRYIGETPVEYAKSTNKNLTRKFYDLDGQGM